MARALWLANDTPPKHFTLDDQEVTIVAIKNDTLQERLLPVSPELMTVKDVLSWAELVRRVTTAYGANVICIEKSMTLDPVILTLEKVLKPYRIILHML